MAVYYHGMVVQAVVKANSQSNGKGQILTLTVPKHLPNGFWWNLEFITTSWIWPFMQIHVAAGNRSQNRSWTDTLYTVADVLW